MRVKGLNLDDEAGREDLEDVEDIGRKLAVSCSSSFWFNIESGAVDLFNCGKVGEGIRCYSD